MHEQEKSKEGWEKSWASRREGEQDKRQKMNDNHALAPLRPR